MIPGCWPRARTMASPRRIVAAHELVVGSGLVSVVAGREHGAGDEVEERGSSFVAARRARGNVAGADQDRRGDDDLCAGRRTSDRCRNRGRSRTLAHDKPRGRVDLGNRRVGDPPTRLLARGLGGRGATQSYFELELEGVADLNVGLRRGDLGTWRRVRASRVRDRSEALRCGATESRKPASSSSVPHSSHLVEVGAAEYFAGRDAVARGGLVCQGLSRSCSRSRLSAAPSGFHCFA